MKFHIGYNYNLLLIFLILNFSLYFEDSFGNTNEIPHWIKNNAGWWANNEIDDETFLNGIQYLNLESILEISNEMNKSDTQIPSWIKNNAGWWANNEIDDETFLNGIQYLIDSKIITLNENFFQKKFEITSGVPGIFKIWTWEKDVYLQNGREVTRVAYYDKIPEYSNIFREIDAPIKNKVAVILPVFTSSAYHENGFYDYFEKKCLTCNTTQIIQNNFLEFRVASQTGARILESLGYTIISDMDVDKKPEILKNFDSIIVLHNEYVTKKMFKAISEHSNVVFLYPNSLYAEIEVNYDRNEITLIRGHGYPSNDISNGFDWVFDNTRPFENDLECKDWKFIKITNGYMLNCYPEIKIVKDIQMLKEIKRIVTLN